MDWEGDLKLGTVAFTVTGGGQGAPMVSDDSARDR